MTALSLVPETAVGVRPTGPVMHRCASCGQAYLPKVMKQPIEAIALQQLASDLDGCRPEAWMFFNELFTAPTRITNVRALARKRFGMQASTLISRFYRAELPSPKDYMIGVKLIRAARLLENPRFTALRVSEELSDSSQQSFGRCIRTHVGLNVTQFRATFTGETMLEKFRAELILPYRDTLRTFQPLLPQAKSAA